ncbi:MAG: ester cyclase [Saprospiraceae bacterium]|nr:ester cyclase [Saprospiraceae bacterium]
MNKIICYLLFAILVSAFSCTHKEPTTSATDDHISISKKAHSFFSENKFDSVLNLASETIQVINYVSGQTFNGKQEFLSFMMGFKTAFPDLNINHTHVFEDGKGNVALEFEATGTHTGPLVVPGDTIAPTGKSVKLFVGEMHRIENGKIVSIHNYQDSGSLMAQLGLMK